MSEKVNIFWFRRDLRLTDNIGLNQALNNKLKVIPLFIFDENITTELDKDDARINFIYKQLESINNILLTKYNSKLLVLKGKPFEVLTHLARHRDQIVSKEQLLDAIWEEPELVTPNVIEVAINQIRQKMDKPLNIATIETIRRRGYRFCYPPKVEKTA